MGHRALAPDPARQSSDVAADTRRSATLRGLASKERAAADDCADYLLKYRSHLDYHLSLAAGVPIATSVIQGACPHLVRTAWTSRVPAGASRGAEAIVRLRAPRSSGDFESYWAFHECREHTRHHAAFYAGPPPPTIVPVRPSRRPNLCLVP